MNHDLHIETNRAFLAALVAELRFLWRPGKFDRSLYKYLKRNDIFDFFEMQHYKPI